MFWNYGITPSNIDKLLDNDPRPPLDQIISEKDVIQEIKGQNEKLINYLIETENFQQMIHFLISGSDSSHSAICTEIITSNNIAIDQALFNDSSFITSIWSVFKQPHPNHEALVNCSRVVSHLCNFNSKEFVKFVNTNEIELPTDLLNHAYNSSVCDLIVRLIINKSTDNFRDFQQFFTSCDLPNKLIQLTAPGKSEHDALAASSLISEILRFIRSETPLDEISSFDLFFTESLFKDETLDILVRNLLLAQNESPQAIACAAILSNIFNLQRCGTLNGEEFFLPEQIPFRYFKFSKQTFSNFTIHVESLINILTKTPSESMLSTNDKVVPVFGRCRLLILETLSSLILYNNEDLAKEFSKFNILNLFMNLFELFPNNSFVHSLVEFTISNVLMGNSWRSNSSNVEKTNEILLDSLFSTNNFIEKLVSLSTPASNFRPHVVDIHRTLRKALLESCHKDFINQRLSNLPDDLNQAFLTTNGSLSELDEMENVESKYAMASHEELEFQQECVVLNSRSQFNTIEKAFDIIRNDKAARTYEDMIDEMENKMQINIDSPIFEDPFQSISISIPSLGLNFDSLQQYMDIVQESIDQVQTTDFSSFRSISSSNIGDGSRDAIEKNTVSSLDDHQAEFSSSFFSSSSRRFGMTLEPNRCGTSSPMNFSMDMNNDEDMFEDEN